MAEIEGARTGAHLCPTLQTEPDRSLNRVPQLEKWYRLSRSRRPPEEQRFWTGLTDHSFDLGSIPTAVRSLGSGPSILLLHGVGGRGSQFSHIARTLADQGWRALIVDLHGHDDRRARRLTVEGVFRIFQHLIRREGPLHGVVTHSMGNVWVWYAMARGLEVDRLVSLSGVFRASWVFEQFQRLHRLTDQDISALKAMLEEHEGADALLLQDPPWAMSRARRPRHGCIIHGTDDDVVPVSHGRAYASEWPNAAYLEIGQVSHADLLAAPGAVAAVSSFFGHSLPLPRGT